MGTNHGFIDENHSEDLRQQFDKMRKVQDGELVTPGTQLLHMHFGPCEMVAGPDDRVDRRLYCIKLKGRDQGVFQGAFKLVKASNLAHFPLTWVEGKPVYPGDTLWWFNQYDGEWLQHKVRLEDSDNQFLRSYLLHWEKPKKKKVCWIALMRDRASIPRQGIVNWGGVEALKYPYVSEELAWKHCPDALAVVKVEWEE